MNEKTKQLRTEIVMDLMLKGTVTPREFATRNEYEYATVANAIQALKKSGVVEISLLARRHGGKPVVLMPKAMASVMEHVKTNPTRQDAIGAMLEEFCG